MGTEYRSNLRVSAGWGHGSGSLPEAVIFAPKKLELPANWEALVKKYQDRSLLRQVLAEQSSRLLRVELKLK